MPVSCPSAGVDGLDRVDVKGLTPANLMACGDGWNDLPMIRLAGLGVAMGNAQAPVKAAADWLTADNDHDGVGLAVEKFILEEN